MCVCVFPYVCIFWAVISRFRLTPIFLRSSDLF